MAQSDHQQFEAFIHELVSQERDAALARRPQLLGFFPYILTHIGVQGDQLLPESGQLIQILSYLAESTRHSLVLPRGLVETTALLFRLVLVMKQPSPNEGGVSRDSQALMVSLVDTIKRKGDAELIEVFDGLCELLDCLVRNPSGNCVHKGFGLLGRRAAEQAANGEHTSTALRELVSEAVVIELQTSQHVECLMSAILPVTVTMLQNYYQLWSLDSCTFLWRVLQTVLSEPHWSTGVRACAIKSVGSMIASEELLRRPAVASRVVASVGAALEHRKRQVKSSRLCALLT